MCYPAKMAESDPQRNSKLDGKLHPPMRSSTTMSSEAILTRAERAHWRLSWEQRLARNARPSNAPRFVVTLHGLPATFASSFGFDLLAIA
jgi:hypothetical protein